MISGFAQRRTKPPQQFCQHLLRHEPRAEVIWHLNPASSQERRRHGFWCPIWPRSPNEECKGLSLLHLIKTTRRGRIVSHLGYSPTSPSALPTEFSAFSGRRQRIRSLRGPGDTGEGMVVVDKKDERLWLLDSKSSTHNESRDAACPMSGVQERCRAPGPKGIDQICRFAFCSPSVLGWRFGSRRPQMRFRLLRGVRLCFKVFHYGRRSRPG